MGAIGEDVLQVAADSGIDERMDAVQQIVGAAKAADARRIEVNELAVETVDEGRAGGFDLDIAEAVIGKARRPHLDADAFQGVGEVLRPAGRALRDQPIGVEEFTGNELHLVAGRAADFDARPAGKIPAQVIDCNPRFDLGATYGGESLLHA